MFCPEQQCGTEQRSLELILSEMEEEEDERIVTQEKLEFYEANRHGLNEELTQLRGLSFIQVIHRRETCHTLKLTCVTLSDAVKFTCSHFTFISGILMDFQHYYIYSNILMDIPDFFIGVSHIFLWISNLVKDFQFFYGFPT